MNEKKTIKATLWKFDQGFCHTMNSGKAEWCIGFRGKWKGAVVLKVWQLAEHITKDPAYLLTK